jgi:hypothetical protein
MSFLSQPKEVILYQLQYLTYDEIRNIARANKRIYNLLNSDMNFWKNKFSQDFEDLPSFQFMDFVSWKERYLAMVYIKKYIDVFQSEEGIVLEISEMGKVGASPSRMAIEQIEKQTNKRVQNLYLELANTSSRERVKSIREEIEKINRGLSERISQLQVMSQQEEEKMEKINEEKFFKAVSSSKYLFLFNDPRVILLLNFEPLQQKIETPCRVKRLEFGRDTQYLPKNLSYVSCEQLFILSMNRTKINEQISSQSEIDKIWNMKSLKFLYLERIPELYSLSGIENLTNLEQLKIFELFDLVEIPEALLRLPNLRTVDIIEFPRTRKTLNLIQALSDKGVDVKYDLYDENE